MERRARRARRGSDRSFLRGLRGLCVQICFLTACASTESKRIPTAPPAPEHGDRLQYGEATWYGKPEHGGPTASGERFNMYDMTAAHRSLHLGTRVRVTNL